MAFVSAYNLFGTDMCYIYGLFVTINAIYSFGGRNIPHVDVFLNAATYPVRVYMGGLAVRSIDQDAFETVQDPCVICAMGFLGILVASGRRIVERNKLAWMNKGSRDQSKLVLGKFR